MRRATFSYLCEQLRPEIEKADTHLRKAIGVRKRIAITLWRLATNVEYRTIAQLFGVGISTVCNIVHQTCQAIVSVLTPKLIRLPKGEALQQIVNGFETRWGFPQCGGAIDGTHLPVLPRGFKTDFYNRKGWFSVVLQGMIDHQYRFMNVNFGFPGSVHDTRVFANSSIFQLGEAGQLFPPTTRMIEGVVVPIVILADSAYPLLPWVMKPYLDNGALTRDMKTFNYRLSRARMVTENTYGRLKGRWRILMKRNDTDLKNIPNLVMAVCTLHNLCETAGEGFDEALLVDVAEGLTNQPNQDEANHMNDAEEIRNALKQHVCANPL
ncbi:protein ANTAGONIST OF LIKE HETEROCHROMATIN PROTEIN 1-like [Patiria miniata]|uniref:DDE Tnp4 domain-containing protein n=1 Tax=Patiria miniata TaxID=46514 RepID=A0A913ZRF2_PATMI|nr:protein ANTAGONIST OF LIKE HETEROCHROMATIN PROTEIN 1-like [Patiria miniata]